MASILVDISSEKGLKLVRKVNLALLTNGKNGIIIARTRTGRVRIRNVSSILTEGKV